MPDYILPTNAVAIYNGNSYWIWDAAVVSNPSINQICIFINVVGLSVDAMMDLATDPGTDSTI